MLIREKQGKKKKGERRGLSRGELSHQLVWRGKVRVEPEKTPGRTAIC